MTHDLSKPLTEICNQLGLEYTNIRELRLRPGEAEATVYRLRHDGAKYITADGEPATETHTFKITMARYEHTV